MRIPALPFCHVTLAAAKPLPRAYPTTLNTLGDHLRKRRLDLKLLQKDVAQKLGVDKASIIHWEKNETSPTVRLIPKIIEFLGYLPTEYLPANTFGQKIVAARKCLGLSQEALARRLGVDPTTVARWERDESQPSPRQMAKLSHRLLPLAYTSAVEQ